VYILDCHNKTIKKFTDILQIKWDCKKYVLAQGSGITLNKLAVSPPFVLLINGAVDNKITCRVLGRMIDEYIAVGELRTGKVNEVSTWKMLQRQFDQHISHMT
jgi:hypothetical protein